MTAPNSSDTNSSDTNAPPSPSTRTPEIPTPNKRQPLRTLLWRSLRCRCPICGTGKLFRQWVRMHPDCPECGEKLSREAGYFLGSIYFNYGLTALLVAIAYPICLFQGLVEENLLLGLSAVFCIVFPIIFFPFARSLWLGFDEFCDPRDKTGTHEER